MKWMFIGLLIVSTISAAGPPSELTAAQIRLRDVITTKLNQKNLLCSSGHRNSCQDALLSSVELNTINSEIALQKLRHSVRGSELQELIDDAVDKLGDVDSAVSEIQEKLDE
jgi:hypothetical protein